MFKNMKITGKIALSFAVMIVVMLIGSGMVFFNMQPISEYRPHPERKSPSSGITSINSGKPILSQRSSVLYLLVASDRSVLNQYRTAKEDLRQADGRSEKFRRGQQGAVRPP